MYGSSALKITSGMRRQGVIHYDLELTRRPEDGPTLVQMMDHLAVVPGVNRNKCGFHGGAVPIMRLVLNEGVPAEDHLGILRRVIQRLMEYNLHHGTTSGAFENELSMGPL